jgi:MerR family transcriptional regulator, mercuric resistance operon regulatory protein
MRAITASRAEGQSIGELSRATGVKIETIRYYERIKMLPSPRRTEGGHRVYGPVEMRSLAFIRRARELGFTLDEIGALLDLGGPGKASCRDVRKIAAHHLEHIRSKIADLVELEKLLARTIAKCSGKIAPDCPVIDVLADRV